VIINPNKHLGDLLIGLDVIQRACDQIVRQGDKVVILLDESYKNLVNGAFEAGSVFYYPRKALKAGNPIKRAHRYLKVLKRIRAERADIALDLVTDSVSSALTYLSGARKRIAKAGAVYQKRYDHVVADGLGQHEYHRLRSALAEVTDLPPVEPCYGKLEIKKANELVDQLLKEKGLKNHRPIVIHPGATKHYKMWPQEHFVTLIVLLRNAGYKPLMIGAGERDRSVNEAINQKLDEPIPDFCDQMELEQVAYLFSKALFYIGNDSGPMHLASACNLPGIALFGPSEDKIWGPLSSKTLMLRGEQNCEPACRRGNSCRVNHQCMRSISPLKVFEKVQAYFD
ncbi:MAG: hypothetical protein GTO40_14575, partial [Deltaproteobacteria bacterium]|nr:hypothetical protein [Deltaproteobacteria bacterium]